MLSNKNPVFRKVIIPWYHSRAVYFLAIFFLFLVFMFGWAGIAVARETEQFHLVIWVPIILVILSGALIISTTIRLIRRYNSK